MTEEETGQWEHWKWADRSCDPFGGDSGKYCQLENHSRDLNRP